VHRIPVSAAFGEHLVPASIFKLGRDLRTLTDRELAQQGITTQQAALMLMTRLHGGHGVHRLADPLGTDTAGLTRLVDRLEAKGLVVRHPSPHDRRALVLELTSAGQELIPDLVAAFRRAHEQLLAGIDEREIEQFQATVQRLRENLRAAAARP
jgi:DNA-binding MarR family transcriptional regulator